MKDFGLGRQLTFVDASAFSESGYVAWTQRVCFLCEAPFWDASPMEAARLFTACIHQMGGLLGQHIGPQ